MVHGSSFSGIGTPEIAAEILGWENAFHCEINPFGRQVLDYYYPNAESYEDITKTDFSKWRGKIDVLTGGFPCQPFSYAGKRRGSEDDRYLWPYMLKCIQQIRPTWFVGENVAGITTMVFPGEDVTVGSGGSIFEQTDYMARDERYVIEEICSQLEECGYSVQPMLIPACAVGAPHRRDRVFIVARRVEAVSEDTMHSRQLHRPDEEQRSERNERNTCAGGGERICGETSRNTADTDSRNLEDCGQLGKSLGEKNCGQSPRGHFNGNIQINEGLLPENRWRDFPTVSPVCGRNDGLPFDVDRLTISFGKWRRESLKAYGNAIVVQCMYEIFRAIDEVSKQQEERV